MRVQSHNKLVRDKIPQILESKGIQAESVFLKDELAYQYNECLTDKLLEEVLEYKESQNIEELADVAEVLYAILEYKGVSLEDFNKIRLDKLDARGGFKNRVFLKDTVEG